MVFSTRMNMPVISLADIVIPPDVLGYVTEPMAQLYRIIPVSFEEDTLTIAMCDPQKLSIIDELRSFLGYEVRAVVATEPDLIKALERYYAADGESVETLIADFTAADKYVLATPMWNFGVPYRLKHYIDLGGMIFAVNEGHR